MLLYDVLLAQQHGQRDSSSGSGNFGWRAASVVATMAAYVGARGAVTGGAHIVNIYRKVSLKFSLHLLPYQYLGSGSG